MKLLANSENRNHKTEILNAIELAEEITICTVFLTFSGLKSLLAPAQIPPRGLLNITTISVIIFIKLNFQMKKLI
jgi:hypothetical protein